MIRTFKLLLSLMLLQNAYAFVKQPSAQNSTIVTDSYYYVRNDMDITDNSMPAPTSARLIDYNNDGYPDLFVCQFNSFSYPIVKLPMFLFKNTNGTGFVRTNDVDVSNADMAGPDDGLVADFNGDGKPDLFIPTFGTDALPALGEQSRLFLSGKDNTLHDVTTTNLPQAVLLTHSACFGDISNRGVIDIYVGNTDNTVARAAQFYINDGKGNFIPDTTRIPADIACAAYTSSALVDVNGDGYLDLVLGGNGGVNGMENLILLNDGTGHFYRTTKYVLPPKLFGTKIGLTSAITAVDINGDGKIDLILATTNGFNVAGLQILLANGDGTYKDISSTDNISFGPGEGWVTKIYVVDFNGDGKKDLFLQLDADVGCTIKAHAFLNNGDNTFTDISNTFGISFSTPSQAAFMAGDINGDGLADIIVCTQNHITTLISQKAQVISHIRTKNNLYNIQK
jgi:hypothetical protein